MPETGIEIDNDQTIDIDCDPMDLDIERARFFVSDRAEALGDAGILLDFASGDEVDYTALANAAYNLVDAPSEFEHSASWQTLAEWAEDKAGAQR